MKWQLQYNINFLKNDKRIIPFTIGEDFAINNGNIMLMEVQSLDLGQWNLCSSKVFWGAASPQFLSICPGGTPVVSRRTEVWTRK